MVNKDEYIKGHVVMKCAACVGVHVDITALVYS